MLEQLRRNRPGRSVSGASILSLVAALAVASCGDPSGLSEVRGTYALASIDGVGPPLVTVDHTFPGGARVVSRVVHDSLRFTADTTVQRSELGETTWYQADGSTDGPLSGGAGYSGRYVRRGDTLIIKWVRLLEPGLSRTDTFHIAAGRLSRSQMVGVGCAEGCPGFRPAVFEYRRQ